MFAEMERNSKGSWRQCNNMNKCRGVVRLTVKRTVRGMVIISLKGMLRITVKGTARQAADSVIK